jgi:hypothetical protein
MVAIPVIIDKKKKKKVIMLIYLDKKKIMANNGCHTKIMKGIAKILYILT